MLIVTIIITKKAIIEHNIALIIQEIHISTGIIIVPIQETPTGIDPINAFHIAGEAINIEGAIALAVVTREYKQHEISK